MANGLDACVESLAARGRAAHPELSVDAAALAAHVAACGATTGVGAAAVHAEDLYLACAALLGDELAVQKLRRVYRPVVIGYLRNIDRSPAFVDEVEQRLWDAALVGSATAPPKLATYTGHGALAGWVGIVAQRIALTMRRHESAGERAAAGAAAEAARFAQDPELAFIKGRMRADFQQALSQALGALEDRERMIYRLHLIDGLTVETIAGMYGVSHSTVSRWLAKARESVVAAAQRFLREDAGLSPAEFNSVAALVMSQLDLSVSRIFKPGPG